MIIDKFTSEKTIDASLRSPIVLAYGKDMMIGFYHFGSWSEISIKATNHQIV